MMQVCVASPLQSEYPGKVITLAPGLGKILQRVVTRFETMSLSCVSSHQREAVRD